MSQLSDQNRAIFGSKISPLIYITAILALTLVCIYLAASKNMLISDNYVTVKKMQVQVDSVKSSREALQCDFDAASAKIDQLVSNNAQLDTTLQRKNKEMARLRFKIRRILVDKNASEKELNEARIMIASLTDKTKEYEVRIATLERENTALNNKNLTLVKEVDSTSQVNIELHKVASVLHTSNLRIETIHKRRNGQEKETDKAKKADVLRIKFDIDENRIAESGKKQMFIRIVGPDGNMLSNKINESGTITDVNGTQVSYSVMKEIMLSKNQIVNDVQVDWDQQESYEKGKYNIEIYNDGYRVGRAGLMLKGSLL